MNIEQHKLEHRTRARFPFTDIRYSGAALMAGQLRYQVDGEWTLPIAFGSHSLDMSTELVRISNDTAPTTWQQLYELAYLINTTLPGLWASAS